MNNKQNRRSSSVIPFMLGVGSTLLAAYISINGVPKYVAYLVPSWETISMIPGFVWKFSVALAAFNAIAGLLATVVAFAIGAGFVIMLIYTLNHRHN